MNPPADPPAKARASNLQRLTARVGVAGFFLAIPSSPLIAQSVWNPDRFFQQEWNVAGNWLSGGIPNADGAIASVSFNSGGSAANTLSADSVAATTIRFGQLTLTNNRIANLGGINDGFADLGNFVISNGASPAVIDISAVNDPARGIYFTSTKPGHFTLESDLEVIKNSPGSGTLRFRSSAPDSEFDGGGNVISVTGRTAVELNGSGYDFSPLKDATLDLRDSTDPVWVLRTAGRWNIDQTTGVTLRIGNLTPTLQIISHNVNPNDEVTGDFGYAIEMFGPVGFNSRANRGAAIEPMSLTGTISDGAGSTPSANHLTLGLFNTPSGNQEYRIAGASPNTYSGGTTVSMPGATLILDKAGALGTGGLTINGLALLRVNHVDALGDDIDFVMNVSSLVIQTGGFDAAFERWSIVGFDLPAGDYDASSGVINGFDFSTQFLGGGTWTVIPEPASLALLASALALVGGGAAFCRKN